MESHLPFGVTRAFFALLAWFKSFFEIKVAALPPLPPGFEWLMLEEA